MERISVQSDVFNYDSYLDVLLKLGDIDLEEVTAITLDLRPLHDFRADGMTPLTATLARLQAEGASITVEPPTSRSALRVFDQGGWFSRETPSNHPTGGDKTMVTVVEFRELAAFVNRALDTVVRSCEMAEGTMTAFEWSLNEVADNVLTHAQGRESRRYAGTAFCQVNVDESRKEAIFTVADVGQGIRASLSRRYSGIDDDLAAIELAIQRGVTSGDGRGFGLAGLVSLAAVPGATAILHSGTGLVTIEGGSLVRDRRAPDHVGTVVVLRFPTDTPIVVSEYLFGHSPVSGFEMDYLSDAGDAIDFELRHEIDGFGSREQGRAVRNKLLALAGTYPSAEVRIRFDNVSVISSAFADELVGKLAAQMGVAAFASRYRLIGLNDFCRTTIDEAIITAIQS